MGLGIRNISLKQLTLKLIRILTITIILLSSGTVAFSWEGSWSNASVTDKRDEYGFLKITANGLLLSANSRLFINYFELPPEAQYCNVYLLNMVFVRSKKAQAGVLFKGESSGLEFSLSQKGFYRITYFETAPKSADWVLAEGEFTIPKNKIIVSINYEPLSSKYKAYVDDVLIYESTISSLKMGVNPPIRIMKVGISAINDIRGDRGEVLVEALSVKAE